MSKTLGTILTIVAIGVAIASGVGALAAGTAALISAGIAAAQVVNSAVLASRAKDALQKRQASVAALQLGEVAREGIFGEVMTGGSLVDAFNWGGQYGTDWECRIIAVADHFCDALVGYYVNDAFVTYTGDGAVPGYNGQLEVYWRSGAVIQTVPDVVLANAPGWTANDFGSGVAWVAVCYKADKADAKNPIWPGGRPGFAWVVRGKRCYQARKDSTAGGSGAHRWSDPSTWEWTDNPIDCRHNWVRGIYAGDRIGDPDMLLVGRGLSAEEAPPANVFAPANVCDEQVALDAGGSEKRYRLNGLVRADETYIEVEDHFAAACAGVILQPEGAVEIEPGQAKAPSFFFSDEDLLVGSSVEYSDELSEADDGWVNTVAPRYVEPSLKYADHAAPIRRVVADVLADGGPREQPLSLTMVTSSTQAGRVGEIARRLGRLRRRGKVTLGPGFAEVEEGDWGVWTSDRYLKGKSVLFRVEAYSLDEKWHNTLTLREITRDVYARDADAASTAVALQQDAPSIGAPGPGAWAATAIVTGAEGRSMPAIAVTGSVDSDYAELVRFEYCRADAGGPSANARWIEAGFAGPDATRFEITGVAASAGYAVAVSYVVGRVPGARRVLATVTTAAASVGWGDVSNSNGKKPADNATNSADPNSAFGSGTVGGTLQHLTAIDQTIEKVREELSGAEGLTQAAIAARDVAKAAATNSITARDDSRAARDSAQKASSEALTSASAAAGSAGTAEGQATIASTKATTATEQASIAKAQATLATTKAGDASTSASSAATSENNASGSATAAATSAQVTASTYQKVIGAVGNEHFDQGTDGWENVGDIQAVATSYGRSNVIRTTPGVKYDAIVGRKVPVTSDSQRFRLSASWRCAAQTATYYFGAVFFDASGNIVAATDGTGNYPLGPAVVLDASKHGWLDRSIVIGRGYVDGQYGGTAGIPAGTVYFRPIMYLNYTSVGGSVSEVDYFTVADVTLEVSTGIFASAAAESAKTAAASQKGAEQKASAAETAQTKAETAAGNAATYRDQASTSASGAAGSATLASIAATVAASSATGDLVKHGQFRDGQSGYWRIDGYETRMIRPADYGQPVPPGQDWVYLLRGFRDVLEESAWNGTGPLPSQAGRIPGEWGNRVIRAQGVASCQFSAYDGYAGFFGLGADGSVIQFGAVLAAQKGVAGYRQFSGDIVVFSGVTQIIPWLQNSAPWGDISAETRWASFSLRDVTEEVRTGQSASAAAGSASTAGTRADEAGRSASAAQTAYTNADASSRNAATSASSASGSASAADSYRASAKTYSEQAASYSGSAGTYSANAKSYYDSTVGATGSLSQKVDTLSTSVGGVENTLKQQSASITAANGRTTVYWEVLGTTDDGKTRVRLSKSDGSRGVFYVDADMVLDGSLLVAGTVTTLTIAPGSVTTALAISGADARVNPGAQVDNASGIIRAPSGTAVRVEYKLFSNYFLQAGNGSQICYASIIRVVNGSETEVFTAGLPKGLNSTQWTLDFPPAGDVKYLLRFRDYQGSGGSYYWQMSQIQLSVLGFKR